MYIFKDDMATIKIIKSDEEATVEKSIRHRCFILSTVQIICGVCFSRHQGKV